MTQNREQEAGASVSNRLEHESGSSWTFTGTTGADGTVTFSPMSAPTGCHTTAATGVTAGGLTWNAGDLANVSGPSCK